MIKRFVPLSDEVLFDPEALKAYPLVPYNCEYLRPNPLHTRRARSKPAAPDRRRHHATKD